MDDSATPVGDDLFSINSSSNSIIIKDSSGNTKVEITGSSSVTDPVNVGNLSTNNNSISAATAGTILSNGSSVTLAASPSTVSINTSSGEVAPFQNKTLTVKATLNGTAFNLLNGATVGTGSVIGKFGIAVYNSSSSSTPIAISDFVTVTATGSTTGNVTIPSNTIKSASVTVGPSDTVLYVRAYFGGGSLVHPNFGTSKSVIFNRPALTNIEIAPNVNKVEVSSGGMLVAASASQFFSLDKASNSESNPFIRSKGFFKHNGTILIGDAYRLKIAQPTSSTSNITFDKNTTGAYIFKTAGGDKFEIRNDGHIHADSIDGNLTGTNYTLKWKYYGSGHADNGEFYYQSSSKRYKKNIENYDISIIDKIKNINVKTFRYNQWADDEEKAIGLIAEDLHDAGINQVVVYGDEGVVDAIDYEKLNVILWKGMQEQQALIESQKTLIDNLTARVTTLED